MAIILCMFLLLLGVMDLSMGVLAVAHGGKKRKINRIFFMVCVGGMLWCLGYGLLVISPTEISGYFFRGLGLLGVFLCCPLIIIYGQYISGSLFKIQKLFNLYVTVGGLICYVLVVLPNTVTFVDTAYGRSYLSNPWFGRYVQYGYLATLFFMWFRNGIKWKQNARYRRETITANSILFAGIVIVIGVMFDTVFPLFGLPAFPSSAIATFGSMYFLYRALVQYDSVSIASQQVTKYIFQTVATPVIILNEDMSIMDCNRQACDYLQCKLQECIGKSLLQWVNGIGDDEMSEIHAEFMNRAESFEYDVSVKKTGTVCQMVVSVIYDEYGEVLCLVSILNDRTAIEKMQAEIDESRRSVQLANASRYAFLKSIDEDIKKPLIDSIEICDQLKSNALADRDRNKVLLLQDHSRKLMHMLEDLVDISQMESGTFELKKVKYDICELLEKIIRETAGRINEEQVDFFTQISPSLPRVMIGDPERLKQVLDTILDNAIQYTKEGSIQLNITYRIRFGKVSLNVKISDTGVGIREEDIYLIFGEFENDGENNSKPSNLGTGLGLTIARNIVKLTGGSMSVQSALGTGTAFSFNVEQTANSEHSIIPLDEYSDKVLLLGSNQQHAEVFEQIFRELAIPVNRISREKIEESHLPEDEGYTLILATAGVAGIMRPILTEKYPKAILVPVYSYSNYLKLSDDQLGICLPLAFSQIGKFLKK